MQPNATIRFKSIADFLRARGAGPPTHPHVYALDLAQVKAAPPTEPVTLEFDFYAISMKRNFPGKIKYGRQEFDFDEGLMTCMAPGHVFTIEIDADRIHEQTGWMLFIHPDFLWNSPLAGAIRKYDFFSYSLIEALFLSEQEEATITAIMQSIQHEYRDGLDHFTQPIILSQIELLLNYVQRFYHRQFLTRQKQSHQLLDRIEAVLHAYFNGGGALKNGLPSVVYLAESLNISPGYLGSLLKVHTGQSTQQHIHNKLIEIAKEKLAVTALTVSEIAFTLGFEHTQSFSKMFKAKTALSPLEFRQSLR